MNYNEMTDLEINKAVALALGCHIRKSAYDTDYYFTDDCKAWDKCAPHGPVENFDPCNSWTDAGPIIQDNKITVLHDEQLGWCAGVAYWVDGYEFGFSKCEYAHPNPLRAGMITFLMMQEVI